MELRPLTGQRIRERSETRRDLLRVLERPESIRPVFQPIVDLRAGTVWAYEALARFPDLPPASPAVYFTRAHQLALGVELETAALSAATAAGEPPADALLSLNVSATLLAKRALRPALREASARVVVEVTEDELVAGSDEVQMALRALRRDGVLIAVDDAGAGYAGFKQLIRLQPDIIKVDRELIRDVDGEPMRAALIESLVRSFHT